ncbi:uncharacterized protein N7479_009686, partial [Penicillium vulpinum]|uniref:uncharacterized protein n=1 Tax=Penicillium vulpinum TaxID=29845 RepID=UPI0025497F40
LLPSILTLYIVHSHSCDASNQWILNSFDILFSSMLILVHTTIGCGKQGFPSAQPYLSHTPRQNVA